MKSDNNSIEHISSTKNPKIKNIFHLQKARERRKQNLFVIEGEKEFSRALEAGYLIRQLYYCPEIMKSGVENTILRKPDRISEKYSVSKEVYNHVVYRQDSEGIIACAEPKDHSLDKIRLTDNPLVLVLEEVEKPGNLGAILRTADASGLDAVIICDMQTDLYNPNVVRSSLGALFTVPIGLSTSEQAIQWLKKQDIRIYCTFLNAAVPYTDINLATSSAIVLGAESTGLSDDWLHHSDKNIIIPMVGSVDSMNVSVSAGIVIYEAIRQRKHSS